MDTPLPRLGHRLGRWARRLTGPILVWLIWGAMTAAAILFIRQHARNIPMMDDFALVPMMAGREPVSLGWAWSQHNEHRPVLSRLILAGVSRYIGNDFRAGKYLNVGLLSVTATSMLVLARRLRGWTSLTDAVLPVSILNVGQAETLMLSFAMNLVLTAWVACALIAAAGKAGRPPGWPMALKFGL